MSEKILPSCIPLPLGEAELDEIVSKAKDYALMHGICMRSKDNFNPDALQVSRQNSRSSLIIWVDDKSQLVEVMTRHDSH